MSLPLPAQIRRAAGKLRTGGIVVFKISKLCFAGGLALLLGGCLTAPPHSMAVSDFQNSGSST
jgi:hypothetical protein